MNIAFDENATLIIPEGIQEVRCAERGDLELTYQAKDKDGHVHRKNVILTGNYIQLREMYNACMGHAQMYLVNFV